MDNILFVPATRDTEWVQEILPGTSPAELPVAGRRVIDYSIERAQKLGVMFTEVLDWRFSERLADDFADMTRTGFPVFYMKGEGDLPRGLDDIDGYSSPLTGNITDGLVIRGVKAWHELNFVVLRNPAKFTLPGYSSERDVHIGRNVVIEHGTNVKPPVLLQDNTWLARNVKLDGEVIVDGGSYISEGARLRRTVVCGDTFIGEGLDLEGKIVVGRRVIDADTGTWVDLEEPGLARHIPAGLGWLRAIWHSLRGRSVGRRG